MEGKIKSFTDLIVWQEAYKLALLVYKTTRFFPKEEAFGLTSQIRRAVVSISSNISEGFGRETEKDRINFYHIARGSVYEVKSQLLIARGIGYLKEEDFSLAMNGLVLTNKLLNGLIRKIKQNV
jgi:four helix bundle protein